MVQEQVGLSNSPIKQAVKGKAFKITTHNFDTKYGSL